MLEGEDYEATRGEISDSDPMRLWPMRDRGVGVGCLRCRGRMGERD